MYHETESKHHSRGHLGPILYITCIRLHPEISPYTTFYQRKVNLSRTKILNSKLPNPKFTRNISFHYGKINPEGKFYIPDYLIQNVQKVWIEIVRVQKEEAQKMKSKLTTNSE